MVTHLVTWSVNAGQVCRTPKSPLQTITTCPQPRPKTGRGEPVSQRAFLPTGSLPHGKWKPDMLRMSCSFSVGRKKREGIPFTEERQSKNWLVPESQEVLKYLWLQYPRWDAPSRHTCFSPSSLASPCYSPEELAAAELPG